MPNSFLFQRGFANWEVNEGKKVFRIDNVVDEQKLFSVDGNMLVCIISSFLPKGFEKFLQKRKNGNFSVTKKFQCFKFGEKETVSKEETYKFCCANCKLISAKGETPQYEIQFATHPKELCHD